MQQTFARQLFAGTAADDPDAVGVISGADAAAELAGADGSLILVHCLAANISFLELLPGELRERGWPPPQFF